MSTHFTVPIHRSPCSGGRYQSMPAGLSNYLTPDDYSASMARIQAANRSSIGVRLLLLVAWLAYIASLFQVCGLFSVQSLTYGQYYVNATWLGWSAFIVSFVSLVCLARYSRARRSAQLAVAVQTETDLYASRAVPVAWRVVNERFVEINAVDVQQQHIVALEQQVHILQAQVAAQQAVDHQLIAQQAAAAQHSQHAPPHYMLSTAAPSGPATGSTVPPPPFHVQYYPTVAAASLPAAEPVYAQSVYQPVAGSVFAHPPPHYYSAQSRTDLRQPLVQQHY